MKKEDYLKILNEAFLGFKFFEEDHHYEYNGKKVVLFKENGKVKYVVPVFEYQHVICATEYKKPKKKWYQIRDRYTFQAAYYEQKMQIYDEDNEYTIIDLYYRDGRYKTIYKKQKP